MPNYRMRLKDDTGFVMFEASGPSTAVAYAGRFDVEFVEERYFDGVPGWRPIGLPRVRDVPTAEVEPTTGTPTTIKSICEKLDCAPSELLEKMEELISNWNKLKDDLGADDAQGVFDEIEGLATQAGNFTAIKCRLGVKDLDDFLQRWRALSQESLLLEGLRNEFGAEDTVDLVRKFQELRRAETDGSLPYVAVEAAKILGVSVDKLVERCRSLVKEVNDYRNTIAYLRTRIK